VRGGQESYGFQLFAMRPAVFEIAARSLFAVPPLEDVPIFTGFARAVVEGMVRGKVWVDNLDKPRAAQALHSYGMSLLWGPGIGESFPAIVAHLCDGAYRRKDEYLQIDPRWGHLDWDKALEGAPGGGPQAQRFTRVNFRFDEALFRARHAEPVLPAGWLIREMDGNAYELPDVSVTPRAFWKDFADFVDYGGGMCAVKLEDEVEDEIGAIAFSATRFDDWLEIGIETRAPYRGLGLARAVAVAMIEKCLAEGLTPIWACRKENTGSFVLAQSLGFVVVKELPFYRLPGK